MSASHQGAADETSAVDALAAAEPSVRLRAAMAAGTRGDPRSIEPLMERCAVESDFFVREMLTWALTRCPASITVPRVIEELGSRQAQARSQALHTLSKLGDRQAWPAITRSLLCDGDAEVARSAWRAAVVLVPDDEQGELAVTLATQLGRGDREMQRSLSRTFAALGDVVPSVLGAAKASPDLGVRSHAIATERLWRDPESNFEFAMEQAKRDATLDDLTSS